MATNQYFNKFKNTAEQRLVEDLVVESIKIHGVDCVYIPRSLVNVDEIFGEDRLPKFENGRDLEMYVDSYDGFEGEGEVMSQFGLEIKDEITLTLAKKRFSETFADKNYPYPREGDLVYFPLSNGLFEINFVEREQNFFNFGKTFTFQIKCSMFVHSGEDIESGWDQIDGATSDVYQQMLYVKLGSTGSGTFTEGENAFLYDGGVTGASILGESYGATYELDSIGFTQDYFVKDPFEDNTNFQFEGSTFLDFTDTDPFSEGDL
jgi:hypothetical protein